MKQPDEKVVHGNTRMILTRDDLKRSLPFIVLGALALVVLVWAAYSFYSQLNPAVNKYKVPSPIDGISQQNTNYSEMTKQQIDLQLKRQIGVSVEELKQQTLSKNTFSSYESAQKAANALRAYKERKKALELYAIIAQTWKDQLDYNFYMDYAQLALYDDNPSLAREQLKLAKPKIDAIRSEESRKEALSTYRIMSARAEGTDSL